MGGTCNCVNDTCNQDQILFTTEINPLTNRFQNNEKLKNINYSNLDDPQYQVYSKEFFNILTDIRLNPERYVDESKEYSLSHIFLKIKSSKDISLSDNNLNEIKKYIIKSYFIKKSLSEQEKELKSLINDGKIKEISFFQNTFTSNDMKENVWFFLHENEDDLEKIFSSEYNYLMVICLPLDYNAKILTSVIFYKQ